MPAESGLVSVVVKPERGDVRRAMWRGFRETCPRCGKGAMFTRYLKVSPRCSACGEDLSHHRADDAPPYFTMMIVGHVLVIGVAALEETWAPPVWLELAIWLPLATIMSLALLPRVKGAIVGLQWAVRMHGFGDRPNSTPLRDSPECKPC